MKDKIFGVLQRVGRSFMLPIAILPVAGLLLGIGSSFTNESAIALYGMETILGEGTVLHALLVIMNRVGSAVFDNLPLLFAVGVAIGMAKKEKEVSALSAVIAYFVMNTAINAMLVNNGKILDDGLIAPDVLEGTIVSACGIQTLEMGVFGGIITGLGVAALHNRFYRIHLPNALSFFGGTRFVPIISTVVYMFVGILLYFVWPAIQNAIYALGALVTGSGYVGTLIFGLIKRALIPFGLHHVFYMPFWQTAVGGTMDVAGQMVQGGQNIFFAQLADSANIAHFSADATRYFSGEFIFMIFGLPGAALAMYHCARPEKKKAAGGLLLSAALACMLTGITEPLEFSFLFVAPALFAVQVVLAGSAYMVAHMLNIAVGLTFSGGLFDFLLFGVLQGNAKTSWVRVIPVGIIYFFLYYSIFRFLIQKYDFGTPGREADDTETKLYTRADVNVRSAQNKDGRGAQPARRAGGLGAQMIHRADGIGAQAVRGADGLDAQTVRGADGNGAQAVRGADGIGAQAVRRADGIGAQAVRGADGIGAQTVRGADGTGAQAVRGADGLDAQTVRGADGLSAQITQGLGGRANISDVDCCATRLRCTVFDARLVDDGLLRATGASGVVHRGDGVQIIYGPQVTVIKSNLEEYLEQEIDTDENDEPYALRLMDIPPITEIDTGSQSLIISSPISGVAADLAATPDEAFAQKMMGDGAVVTPDDPIVRAPEDGEVLFVFETRHAIGFRTDTGINLLIHIGIDTVELDGAGFESFVENGQKVRKGDPMLKLDLEYLRAHAPSLASPILCTELKSGQNIRLLKEGKICAGEALFEIVG